MKLFKPFIFVACCFVGTVNAATTQAFKDAAFNATVSWNGVQYKCVEYAKSLDTFIKANSTKYAIKSYSYYEINNADGKGFMAHDDFDSGKNTITQNGRHVITIVDGEVFDNYHPKGAVKATWDSKLHNPAGTYPKGFTTTVISNIQQTK